MSHSILSIRVDEQDKKRFESFCGQTGTNVSVAVNMFVKAVLREQRIPFEVKTDPFYNETNMARLERAIADIEAGKVVEHELIEVEDD